MHLSQPEQQKEFYNSKFRKIASSKMEENIRNFYIEKLTSLIFEKTNVDDIQDAFEVGVGEGTIMKKMSSAFKNVKFKGVDITERSVQKAQEKGLDVSVMDANNIVLDQQYDLIYGTAILHHLDDIEGFLTKIHQYLKPNGVILFGAETAYYEFFYTIYHMLRGSWGIEKGMMNVSKTKFRRYLGERYKDIYFCHHGNCFVYFSKGFGSFWNKTGLSKIPFLNDIYLFARKA